LVLTQFWFRAATCARIGSSSSPWSALLECFSLTSARAFNNILGYQNIEFTAGALFASSYAVGREAPAMELLLPLVYCMYF
jgi:hypothetical protein